MRTLWCYFFKECNIRLYIAARAYSYINIVRSKKCRVDRASRSATDRRLHAACRIYRPLRMIGALKSALGRVCTRANVPREIPGRIWVKAVVGPLPTFSLYGIEPDRWLWLMRYNGADAYAKRATCVVQTRAEIRTNLYESVGNRACHDICANFP